MDDMSEPYDTGCDPLNAALDDLREVMLAQDSTHVGLIVAALHVLSTAGRPIKARPVVRQPPS